MNDRSLNWKDFDWKDFQTLCIRIAESSFPDVNFAPYLKEGQKQDGLDLITTFSKRDGSFLGVQCKDVQEMTVGDIEKAIKDFRNGEYRDKLSHFILATSADLQSRSVQVAINNRKQSLQTDHGIAFECWDRSVIEIRLKKMWSVVAKYFGIQQADQFCYQQLSHSSFDNIKPVDDYIPRRVSNFTEDITERNFWQHTEERSFDLKNLFLEERLDTRRICLIGDAYQGKSFYLKQAAYDLMNAGVRIQPLFIEIKASNVQSLETILDKRFGAWKNIPLKDIILFIDGLDEVPTDKFDAMLKYIAEFSNTYSAISMVVSCRKLFFSFYEVGKTFNNFEVFKLGGMNSENIDTYLKTKLGPLFHGFKDAIYKNELLALLYQPFYLVNLAIDYAVPPNRLPGSKLKVLDAFIERSLTASNSRQLKDSDRVKMNSLQFKKTIEKFAFALQLAGANSFEHTQIQELFTREEQMLLQHNSLVTIFDDKWSFNNALFQEHLAASLLSQLPFEEIIRHCSIGTTHPKVKTKWIQTLSSALSLLDEETELFKKLLKFIENDNIELIFQTERSKYTPDFRQMILKSFIEKCKAQNIRSLIIYEETIGIFVEGVPASMNYLMDCIGDDDVTDLVKIVCARIIRNSSMSDDQQVRFRELAMAEIRSTNNPDYAGNLLEVFNSFKIGDKGLIKELIEMPQLTELHAYRSPLYELITTLELVDDFYDYGLAGIPAFIKYNEHITHGGSETDLQNFLLATNKRFHLAQLLKSGKERQHFTYIDYRGSHKETLLRRLFQRLAEFFEKDPLIIIHVAKFIGELGRRFLREELKDVQEFLVRTNTHDLVLRLLINDLLKHYDWEVGTIVKKESYDYVLWEFEECGYEMQSLRSVLVGMRYRHNIDLDNTFYDLCMAVTGGEVENKEADSQYLIYQEAEAQKKRNDLIYIQSLDEFKKGVKQYFKHYGKKTIPEDDLYIESDHRSVRQQSDSFFLYEFLAKWVPKKDGKTVTEKEALTALLTPGNFEMFRADEILDYPHLGEEAKSILVPILEAYYIAELPSASFENAIWPEPGKICWHRKELRLGEIFRKYQFDTEEKYLLELIWLDQGGSRLFEPGFGTKKDGIAEFVLNKLDQKGLENLKAKVVANLKTGIKLESVLGTHIALCKKLHIEKSQELILKVIKENESDSTLRIDSINAYIILGGDINSIIAIFRTWSNYNDYTFLHLCNMLSKTNPDVVVEVGKLALNHADTSDQRKILIAEILAQVGDLEGFKYLVNDLRMHKIVNYHMGRGTTVTLIDTATALKEMEDVMYLVVDGTYYNARAFHDTVRYLILEWIYQLAAKSESDLGVVANFLVKSRDQLLKSLPSAVEMNWYINRIFENFRGSDKTSHTIKEIKTILQSIQ